MSTINVNIDSQFPTKTEILWGADATVYGENYGMLISSDAVWTGTDQRKFKIPNGVDTWANLDYPPIGGGASTDTVIVSYANVTGNALVDNSTYYIGQMTGMGTTVNALAYIPLPAGTVIAALIQTYNGSTFGTSENATISLISDAENTGQTDVLASTVTCDARHTFLSYTGLSISILEGSSYLLLQTPAYATNPANAQIRVSLIIEL